MCEHGCAVLCMAVDVCADRRDDAAAWVYFTPFKLALSHTSNSKNVIQGMTPLHFACSTGMADCVKYLAEQGADLTVVDKNGRGCLQFASQVQGKNQTLWNYLRKPFPYLRDTNGVAEGEKKRGRWAQEHRDQSVRYMPRCKKPRTRR